MEQHQRKGAGRGFSGRVATGVLVVAAAICLIGGGALLDAGRIHAVKTTLDRVAAMAAIDAAEAATTSPASAQAICQRRFARHVWTDTEVTIDSIDVSVENGAYARTSTVAYDATVTLSVGRFFGLPEIELSGESEIESPIRRQVPSHP